MTFIALLSTLICLVSTPANAVIDGVDPAFENLLNKLIRDGQDSTYVVDLFQHDDVRFIESLVVKNMIPRDHPADYSRFLTTEQIQDGYRFWEDWKTDLERTLEGSEIPSEISVAILKVESNFGRYAGDKSVLSVLATLGSMNPPEYWLHLADASSKLTKEKLRRRAKNRSSWAYRELISFLEACDREGWDPREVKGSWAGAFGLAQFLPSSYLHYARDGDGDEVIDPNNVYDAVASMAWYLKKAGWGKSNKARRKAILRYNPSSAYADCILDYARQLRYLSDSAGAASP
jgi:membrane-bound lytic murein transglycosylase B